MDDLGILARDYGFRPQGKSTPMAASKSAAAGGTGSLGGIKSVSSTGKSRWSSTPLFGGVDGIFGPPPSRDSGLSNHRNVSDHHDASRRRPLYAETLPKRPPPPPPVSGSPFESLFSESKDSSARASSSSINDKPVYDGDIFVGVPGLKNSATVKFVDVFSSIPSSARNDVNQYDDLLGNFGRTEPMSKVSSGMKRSGRTEADVNGFADLISGFQGSSPSADSLATKNSQSHHSTKSGSSVLNDPFGVFETPAYSHSGVFTDSLEQKNKPSSSGTSLSESFSAGGVFDDINAFDGLTKSAPLPDKYGRKKISLISISNLSPPQASPGNEHTEKAKMSNFENIPSKMSSFGHQRPSSFSDATRSSRSYKTTSRNGFNPKNVHACEPVSRDLSPKSDGNLDSTNDVWLTVSEIPLFTQLTCAPPPSRLPPKPMSALKGGKGSLAGSNARRKVGIANPVKNYGVSSLDELEAFAMDKPQAYADEHLDTLSVEEDREANAAVTMKEAMDRAEAKFKHTKEASGRDRDAKVFKSREYVLQEDEKAIRDVEEQECREKKERLEREQKEKKEKQLKGLEERKREREIAREKAIQSVERVLRDPKRAAAEARLKAEKDAVGWETAEARERAIQSIERVLREAPERAAAEVRLKAEKATVERETTEARERAIQSVERVLREAQERAAAEARLKAERAAVDRVTTETRERAEWAAVQRVAVEARERAAVDARERAEKTAFVAKLRTTQERASAEAREKAAVERVAAEVRLRAERVAVERATAEARERAAAAAREKQLKNDDDLESFFSKGARPTNVPRQRYSTSESPFDAQIFSRGGSDGTRWASVGTGTRKASPTTNIVNDLASMFGVAATSTGEFQEVEGETEERRKARLERHQRTMERAKKAVDEKNERDMQTQREQAERHKIAETLDNEIKRWAAGKEGNLRSMLSTLQYVLWPDCGWQPVSLTDLITAASVKKVYRKATLCIHPDKVQQKGANLRQKYIAEKVFDLLKEAWNKFNSEELF